MRNFWIGVLSVIIVVISSSTAGERGNSGKSKFEPKMAPEGDESVIISQLRSKSRLEGSPSFFPSGGFVAADTFHTMGTTYDYGWNGLSRSMIRNDNAGNQHIAFMQRSTLSSGATRRIFYHYELDDPSMQVSVAVTPLGQGSGWPSIGTMNDGRAVITHHSGLVERVHIDLVAGFGLFVSNPHPMDPSQNPLFPSLTIDQSIDRIYWWSTGLAYTDFGNAQPVYFTDNGGASWDSTALAWDYTGTGGYWSGSAIEISQDNSSIAVWQRFDNAPNMTGDSTDIIVYSRTDNGGATWTQIVPVWNNLAADGSADPYFPPGQSFADTLDIHPARGIDLVFDYQNNVHMVMNALAYHAIVDTEVVNTTGILHYSSARGEGGINLIEISDETISHADYINVAMNSGRETGNGIGFNMPTIAAAPDAPVLFAMWVQWNGADGGSINSMYADTSARGFFTNGIWSAFSNDAGNTWSAPEEIASIPGFASLEFVTLDPRLESLGGGQYRWHGLWLEDRSPGVSLFDEGDSSMNPWVYARGEFNALIAEGPQISISPNQIDFAPTFAGFSDTLNLRVNSVGTDTLLVSDISILTAEFGVSPTNFSIGPGEYRDVEVVFSPSSVGSFSDTLVITSNDSVDSIVKVALSGEGVLTPDIDVSTTSFSFTLDEGDSIVTSFTIRNLGDGELTYTITDEVDTTALLLLTGPEPIAVVTRTLKRLEGEYPPLNIETLSIPIDRPVNSEPMSDLKLARYTEILTRAGTEGTILFSDDMESGINGWVHYITDSIGSDQWGQTSTRANSGSISWNVTQHSGIGSDALQSPNIDLSSSSSASLAFYHYYNFDDCSGDPNFEPDGGIVEISTDDGSTWTQIFPDDGYPYVLDDICGNPLAFKSAYSHDSDVWLPALYDLTPYTGNIIAIRFHAGWDCGNCNFNEGWFIDDVVVFAGDVAWLSETPDSGTVQPGDSVIIAVKVFTDLLDGGHFNANILISSNDPDEGQITLPVALKVIGTPEIHITLTLLDFEKAFIGFPSSEFIKITNQGSDTLKITDILFDNPEYSTESTSIDILAGTDYDLKIDFMPTAAGFRFGVVNIRSNDADEDSISIALVGEGVPPPDIELSADSLFADLFTGEVDSQSVTISNIGLSDLNYEIFIVRDSTRESLASAQPENNIDLRTKSMESESGSGRNSLSSNTRPEIGFYADESRVGTGELRHALTPATSTVLSDSDSALILNKFDNFVFGNTGIAWVNDTLYSISFTDSMLVSYDLGTESVTVEFPIKTFSLGLAWDGTNLWIGSLNGNIYGYDLDGTEIGSFSAPFISFPTLAWDGEYFIMSSLSEFMPTFYKVDVTGAVVDSFTSSFSVSPTQIAWAEEHNSLWLYDSDQIHLFQVELVDGTTNLLNEYVLFDSAGFDFAYSLTHDGTDLWWSDWDSQLHQVDDGIDEFGSWITLIPSSGVIAAGASADVDVIFDAEGLFGGNYYVVLDFESNDPATPVLNVPVHLKVTGAPDAVLSVDTLNFGTVFTTPYEDTLTVTLVNRGTDTLKVSEITSDAVQINASPTSPFVLLPTEKELINIVIQSADPVSVSGTVTIHSNDPDEPLLLLHIIAEVVAPPVISVSPDSLDDHLFSGDSSSQIVTIQNTGGSDLTFNIRTQIIDSASLIVSAKIRPESMKSIQDGRNKFIRVNEPSIGFKKRSFVKRNQLLTLDINDKRSNSISLSKNENIMASNKWNIDLKTVGREILWQSPSVKNKAKFYRAMESYSQVSIPLPPLVEIIADPAGDASFVDVIAVNAGVSQDEVTFQIVVEGVLDPFDFAGILSLDTDQDSTTGIDPSFGNLDQDIGAEYEIFWFDADSAFVIDQFGNFLGGFPRVHEDDRTTVTIPLEVFGGDDGNMDVTGVFGNLSGPTDWVPDAGHGTLIHGTGWLSASPDVGIIPANSTLDIEIQFDADGLFGGDYYAELVFQSNDPDPSRREITISVHLGVTGVPDIFSDESSIDFGQVFVGYNAGRSLTIRNVGTDTLFIDNISTNLSQLTLGTIGQYLLPGASESISLTLLADNIGTISGLISVSSNDPDMPQLDISVLAEAVFAPVAAVSPLSIVDTLMIDQSSVISLTIANTGGSDLYFIISESTNEPASFVSSNSVLESTPPVSLIFKDRSQSLIAERNEASSSARTALTQTARLNTKGFEFGTVLTELNSQTNTSYDGNHNSLSKISSTGTFGSGQGGPDNFGHTWIDSDEPGGPVFDWVDISSVGTAVFLGDDDNTGLLDLGFDFSFYDNLFSQVAVSSNGWLSFTNTSGLIWTDSLPSMFAPENVIALYAYDLFPASGSSAWYYSDTANNRFIFQFSNWGVCCGATPYFDMQAILYADGRIILQYLSVTGFDDVGTVGIQNAERDDGLTVSTLGNLYIHDNLAVLIHRGITWLEVNPAEGTVPQGQTVNVDISLNAAGLTEGDYVTYLSISTNDPETPQITVPVQLIVDGIIGVDTEDFLPKEFALEQNYPNPFNPTTRINYALPKASSVSLIIYNMMGQEVIRWNEQNVDAGYYSKVWNGKNKQGMLVSSGIYIYRLVAGDFTKTKKMVLLK